MEEDSNSTVSNLRFTRHYPHSKRGFYACAVRSYKVGPSYFRLSIRSLDILPAFLKNITYLFYVEETFWLN